MKRIVMVGLAGLAVGLASGTASARSHAGYYPETDDQLEKDDKILEIEKGPVSENGVGLELGTFHTGPIYDFAIGLALESGVRIDRLSILGQYDLLGLMNPNNNTVTNSPGTTAITAASGGESGSSTTPGGLAQRIGGVVRYSLARSTTAQQGMGIRFDIWTEAGLGEQLVRWSDGGYYHRHDIDLGIGLQLQMRGLHHHGGFTMAFRAILSSPPGGHGPPSPPTCAGPCDGPTGPLGVDHAFLAVMGIPFGS